MSYFPCRNPNKSVGFRCGEFKLAPASELLWNPGSIVHDDTAANSPITYETQELDLINVLDDIFDASNQVVRDLKVDDRDFRTFENFWDFSYSKDGLGIEFYSRQLYALMMLFHEVCPHCSNPKYIQHIKDVPLDMHARDFPEHFQLLVHGVCPKCKRTKLDLFRDKSLAPYQELAGLAGQRVGKSLIVAGGCAYLTMQQLKLQNPSKVYGVLNTTIVGTFVGLTFNAAVEQLWLPYMGFLQSSPWMLSYLDMLKDYGNRHGEEIVKVGATSLHFLHRNILTYPSGPNKKTLRGKTRFFAGIDELDFFNDDADGEDQVKMNGVEVYKSLNNSLLTLRVGWKDCIKQGKFGVPNGYQFNVSSPQSVRGVLTSHVNKNLNSRKVYAFHAATWEINPRIKKSDLSQEYKDDPIKAERDFGANPPMSDSGFMNNPEVIRAVFSGPPNAISYKYLYKKVKSGANRKAAKLVSSKTKNTIPPSILTIDAGFSANSFAITVGYPVVHPVTKERVIHVIAVADVIPDKGVNTLDYSTIAEQLMYPLIEQLNVKAVFADRWNSLKVLHDIEAKFNIYTAQYSVKYRDFLLFKNYAEEKALILPKLDTPKDTDEKILLITDSYPSCYNYKPMNHLFLQMHTVRDTERDVIKGQKLTDDIFRALVLLTTKALDEAFCEKYLVGNKERTRPAALGTTSMHVGVTNASNMGAVGNNLGMATSNLYAIACGSKN